MLIKNFLKDAFSKKNLFYTLIFIIDIIFIVSYRIVIGFKGFLWVCDLASIFSILSMIFNAKHSIWGLIFNLFATITLIFTNYFQSVWLNFFICIVISLPSYTYGIIRWHKNEKNNKSSKNLNKLSTKSRIIFWSSYAVASIVFIFILKAINSNLPIFDAFYSIGCVFGVILASLAIIDQFLFFTFANISGITMYILLTIQSFDNITLAFTAVLYFIMNIIGYINWKKIMKNEIINDTDNETNDDNNLNEINEI